jgi:hypothetical protein
MHVGTYPWEQSLSAADSVILRTSGVGGEMGEDRQDRQKGVHHKGHQGQGCVWASGKV